MIILYDLMTFYYQFRYKYIYVTTHYNYPNQQNNICNIHGTTLYAMTNNIMFIYYNIIQITRKFVDKYVYIVTD